jgi:hypothetical protein
MLAGCADESVVDEEVEWFIARAPWTFLEATPIKPPLVLIE